jgi:hypothetical protein
MNREFFEMKISKIECLKILAHKSKFSAFEAQAFWCQETQPTNLFRDDSSLAEGRAKLATSWLKRGLSSEVTSSQHLIKTLNIKIIYHNQLSKIRF